MIIQYIATGIIVLILFQSFIKILRDRTSFLKNIIFILFWGATLTLIWVPEIMGWLGKITGVGRGVDVLVYLSIIFLFYYVLRQNNKIDILEEKMTKLVREIAKNETGK